MQVWTWPILKFDKLFCIFECLLPQKPSIKSRNSLDSSKPHERLLEDQKKDDLRNYFCLKMISKVAPQNLFKKIIQILEAWKPTKDIKFRLKFFCTCPSVQKCKIILLQAALKNFWYYANLKLNFVKTLTSLGLYILKKKHMQEWGFLGVTFVCKWFKILLHSEFSEKKLNLEGLQTYERHENHLIMS